MRARTVVYEDGSEADVDLIVLATGYNIGYPFLKPQSLVPIEVVCHVKCYVRLRAYHLFP